VRHSKIGPPRTLWVKRYTCDPSRGPAYFRFTPNSDVNFSEFEHPPHHGSPQHQETRSTTMENQEGSVPPAPKRTAWNKGKLIGAKPPLSPRHVWSIRTKLQIEGRIRELALFNLAIDSKLRGCDVVALRVEDIAPNGYAVARATVRQKKTGRPVRFELTEQTRQAIDAYLKAADKKPGEFLFTNRRRPKEGMTTRQYARLVSEWIAGIGLDPKVFGTHSLRRTKATLIYRRTGNLRAVQLLLGHTKIESTVRYLGIEVDDALAIAEQVDV
jgi:integrase